MTTVQQAKAAISDNLQQVFGEADASKRREALSRIWTSSVDSVFVDPEKTFHGHDEIDQCVAKLHEQMPGWVFVETGAVTVMPPAGDAKVRFARVRWQYGPAGETPKVFGEDVAVVVDGKMQSLCAFIDGG